MQSTILNPISCYGIGVHSGVNIQLTLKPAKENTGIVFVRTDVTAVSNFIEAAYYNVHETTLATGIKNSSGIQVGTIEHIMAAIWGCGIDNLIVELDGPEVPVMDGSSKPFVFMIECAGRKMQNAPKKYLKILKEIRVSHKDCEIIATPADRLNIDLTIDFATRVIGKQTLTLSDIEEFREDVADARTFGFVHEVEFLQSKGLAQGASLDNAIGIDKDTILNPNGLRYKDEFVRHKMLDWVGDLYSAGGNMISALKGYKTSHALNNQFLRELFSNPYNYEWVSTSEL